MSEDNDIVQKLTSAEVYVNYVIEFIDEYKRQVKLVDKHDMILPSYLNRAIAEYGSHSATLVSEEARLRGYLKEVKRDFDKWNSRTFMEVRTRLNNESTSKKQIAVKEIEMAVKTYHADKYYEFTEAMENTELKIDYIHNLASFWKKQDNMLSNLSYNMRSELKSLSVQSRANGETEQSKRRKLKD